MKWNEFVFNQTTHQTYDLLKLQNYDLLKIIHNFSVQNYQFTSERITSFTKIQFSWE